MVLMLMPREPAAWLAPIQIGLVMAVVMAGFGRWWAGPLVGTGMAMGAALALGQFGGNGASDSSRALLVGEIKGQMQGIRG